MAEAAPNKRQIAALIRTLPDDGQSLGKFFLMRLLQREGSTAVLDLASRLQAVRNSFPSADTVESIGIPVVGEILRDPVVGDFFSDIEWFRIRKALTHRERQLLDEAARDFRPPHEVRRRDFLINAGAMVVGVGAIAHGIASWPKEASKPSEMTGAETQYDNIAEIAGGTAALALPAYLAMRNQLLDVSQAVNAIASRMNKPHQQGAANPPAPSSRR